MTDDVAVSSPKVVEWFLHSDVPIGAEPDAFILGSNGPRVTIEGVKVQTEIQPTVLMAPGQPGSITKGERETRGYHLRIWSSPVTAAQLRTQLRLIKPAPSR